MATEVSHKNLNFMKRTLSNKKRPSKTLVHQNQSLSNCALKELWTQFNEEYHVVTISSVILNFCADLVHVKISSVIFCHKIVTEACQNTV